MSDTQTIRLVPMTDAEYPAFKERLDREYAEHSAAAGRVPPENALAWAREASQRLLPDGLRTPHTWILRIVDMSGEPKTVGHVWYARDADNPSSSFIYDLYLLPEHRGRGYGTSALNALHERLQGEGYTSVGLHVFADNEPALRLYRKVGYSAKSHVMRKPL